jgi:thioredoxin 1
MTVIALHKENFDEIVGPKEIVVVDFTADWCEPCQSFNSIVEKLAERYADVVFGQVNVGQEPELAADFNVRSVPTVMILRQNVAVYLQSGLITTTELERLILEAKALSMNDIREHIIENLG